MASDQPVPFLDQTVRLSAAEFEERRKRTTDQQLRRLYNSPEYAQRYGGRRSNASKAAKWVVPLVLVSLLVGSALRFTDVADSFRDQKVLPHHKGQGLSPTSQTSQTAIGGEALAPSTTTETTRPEVDEFSKWQELQELAKPFLSTDSSELLPSQESGALLPTSQPSSSRQHIIPATVIKATSAKLQQPNQELAGSLSTNHSNHLESQNGEVLPPTSQPSNSRRQMIPATATEATEQIAGSRQQIIPALETTSQTTSSGEHVSTTITDSAKQIASSFKVNPNKQPGTAQMVLQILGSHWSRATAAYFSPVIILLLLALLATIRQQQQCSVRMQHLAEMEAEDLRAALQQTRAELRSKSQAVTFLQQSLERAEAAVVEARAKYSEVDDQRQKLRTQGWNLRCEIYDTQQALERARTDANRLRTKFEQDRIAQEEQAEEETQALAAALQQTRLDLDNKEQSVQLLLQTLRDQEAAVSAATNQISALKAAKTALENQVQQQAEAVATLRQALENAASETAKDSELYRQDNAQATEEALKAALQQTRLELDEKTSFVAILLQKLNESEAKTTAAVAETSRLEAAKSELAEVVKGQLGALSRLRTSLRQAESAAGGRVKASEHENNLLQTQASPLTALSPPSQNSSLQLPISPASTSCPSPGKRENRDPRSPPVPYDRRQPGFRSLKTTDKTTVAAAPRAGISEFAAKPETPAALCEQPDAARGQGAPGRSIKTPFFQRKEAVSNRPPELAADSGEFNDTDRPAASERIARKAEAAPPPIAAKDTAQDRAADVIGGGAATRSLAAAGMRNGGACSPNAENSAGSLPRGGRGAGRPHSRGRQEKRWRP